MIVNMKQYEQLRHELLRQLAPNLWVLLHVQSSSDERLAKRLAKWQPAALRELRALARFPMPDRGYLD